MSAEHPYADGLMREMLAMLPEGYELPFDEHIVQAAAYRTSVADAACVARRCGRRFLAWQLDRLYRSQSLKPDSYRDEP